MPEWIGKTIGNVRIEKLLARGGMAEVYLGSHLNLERPVAVKLLHSYIEEEPLLLERFRREAKVVAGLRHPNIVQIFDFDTMDGHPYIVMEYLKGPTLATYLRHLHQRKKRIPPDQVARLLNELSTAMDYAHRQGVVHRDIKPGNVLLYSKNEDIGLDKPLSEDVEAVITDFGLVRIMNTSSQTASGTVSGTPAYMSPEQARGDPTDHRTDIYSLGIVLYEMLAGRVPFEADSTLTVLHMQIHTTPPPVPGIPTQVQAVIDRALLKNPEDRYQSSRELAMDYARATGVATAADATRQPVVTPVPVEVETASPTEVEAAPVLQPVTKPESKPVLEPQVTPRSQSRLDPTPTPAPTSTRSRSFVPVLLLSVIGLAVLAGGAFFLLSRFRGSTPPVPTQTVAPEVVNTNTSPAQTAVPALPSSNRMVQIPADTYQVGKNPEGTNQSAVQSISLPAFWIDQYPVTHTEFQQVSADWSIPPGKENHPVMGVTWDQADAYCKSVSKRLPKEAEWEAAGRGPGENPPLYPWGEDATDGGNTFDLPNDTYEVGTKDFNVSPLGVYDLLYNVYEWVGEPYGSLEAGNHILRGARYSTPYDLTFRSDISPDDTQNVQYAGFRCAADQVQ
ncbi:MAG TPA: bifunctional serine/threonine-protein kinase/formylglycine-generating enzyme family protein [Anaerolineales bacterium]|jgi:serine/threonine-protein kinase|nr:bifunctional serine/threonine-protein kinase/formylglycine-generating enzyme family protein [Anaerolineales bacterium]